MKGREERQALLFLALAWAGTHLPLWLGAEGAAWDMACLRRAAACIREGHCLYQEADARLWRYGPLWAFAAAFLSWLAPFLSIRDAQAFKIPAMLADLGIAVLLWRMLSRLAPPLQTPLLARRSFWAAFCAAAFPLSALVSAGHGQFDSVALFLILCAAWYLEFSSQPRSDLGAALCLAFAVAVKTWPIFFLPLFLRQLSRRRERLAFAGIVAGLPAALLLPFLLSCGAGALWRHFSYSAYSAFGLLEALRAAFFAAGGPEASFKAVLAVLMRSSALLTALAFAAPLLPRLKLPLLPSLSLAVLTLYVFAPGYSIQYLSWLFPLALLSPTRLALRAGLALLGFGLAYYLCFAPEALFPAARAPQPGLGQGFFLFWSGLNLGLWAFLVLEWRKALDFCLRQKGRWVEP